MSTNVPLPTAPEMPSEALPRLTGLPTTSTNAAIMDNTASTNTDQIRPLGWQILNDDKKSMPESQAKEKPANIDADMKNKTTTNESNNSNNNNEEKLDDSMYECNICLDTAKDAVVSMCGHLFCWPCLHQWLETRPNRKLCPVCKAAIDKDKVIPLYGRNTTKQEDPRNKIPPRPAGQRIEPEPHQGFPGFGFGDGFHMSFGIGAFPFGYIASSFNFGEPRPGPVNRGGTQYDEDQQLSKLFLYLAFLCIAWLLFA